MQQVYSHYDSSQIGLLNGILNESGIPTILKNFTGSNIVEVPIPSLYPSIHVLEDKDAKAAKAMIAEYLNSAPKPRGAWECSECGKDVDGELSECWFCQAER